MFERFTESARDVVVGAQAEAQALGHGSIGTEHLLIAAAAASAGPARAALDSIGVSADALREAVGPRAGLDADALASIGIDLDEVRRHVEEAFGPGALDRGQPRRGGRMPFTKRAKKVLELALREAVARGDRHIGSEHIVLGILRDGGGGAVEALGRVGVAPERVREALGVPSA
jgi:ATP-dependent Clp protease ATP-binding subunit ClpA